MNNPYDKFSFFQIQLALYSIRRYYLRKWKKTILNNWLFIFFLRLYRKSVNENIQGITMLMVAACEGNTAAVKQLIEAQANVNHKNEYGKDQRCSSSLAN